MTTTATRLYLPSSGTPACTPAATSAVWDVTTISTGGTAPVLPMSVSKTNTAFATTTTAAETVVTNAVDYLLARFVSAETISSTRTIGNGSFRLVVRGIESNAAANAFTQVVIKVVSGDGATERGVLYAGNAATTAGLAQTMSEEYGTSLATKLYNGVSLSSVAAQAGDRILVEIGCRFANVVTTSYTAGIEFGDPTATADMPPTYLGAQGDPWIEFTEQLFTTPPTDDYNAIIRSQSPTFYWRLNEISNNMAMGNVSGTNLRADVVQTVTTTTGLLAGDTDGAYSIDDITGQVSSEAGETGRTQFSFTCLINTSQVASATSFVGSVWSHLSGTLQAWYLGLKPGGVPVAKLGITSNVEAVGDRAINDGRTHHLAITFGNTDKTLRLYVDGLLLASQVQPANMTIQGTNLSLAAQTATTDTGGYLGVIDEAAYWLSVLTDAQIEAQAAKALTAPAANSLNGRTNPATGAATGTTALTGAVVGTTTAATGALTATRVNTANLAGTTAATTGAMTGTRQQTAFLDGTTPVPFAVMEGAVVLTANLAGITASVDGALTGTVTNPNLGDLGGTTAPAVGSLTGSVGAAIAPVLGDLSGSTAATQGGLTGTVAAAPAGNAAILTGSTAAATGTLTAVVAGTDGQLVLSGTSGTFTLDFADFPDGIGWVQYTPGSNGSLSITSTTPSDWTGVYSAEDADENVVQVDTGTLNVVWTDGELMNVHISQYDTGVVVPAGDGGGGGGGAALFAGHIPLRTFVGMASPADSSAYDPGWTEAQTIIGQPIYEARRFEPTNYSSSGLDGMLALADAANAFPVLSFKYSDWAGVAAGHFDTDLIALCNYAKARRTAGGDPFGMSFNHEPAGDGNLADWAAMQRYCSYFFSGRRGGTAGSAYVAADDVRDIMPRMPGGNRVWLRTSSLTDAHTANPPTLIDALRTNNGALLCDTYDCDYVNQSAAMTDVSYRTPGTGVRCHVRISNFITWARSKNSGAIGLGEFGVIDGTEMAAVWAVIRANRDIFAIANYFNSGQNSDHDWRLIPSTFSAGNPVNSGSGLVDFGGDSQSAGRLAAFKTMLTESISTLYTT